MKWRDKELDPPPQNEMVLCWNPNKDFPYFYGIKLEAGASPGVSIDFGWRKNITHWMPLPKIAVKPLDSSMGI